MKGAPGIAVAAALAGPALGNSHISSRADFQQCVINAVDSDPLLYAFPESLLDNAVYYALNVQPYNLDHPWLPAAITYPTSSEQVSALVKCAAAANVATQARSGGHSYENYCLGGANGSLVIDVNRLKSFTFNVDDGTVTFGSGNHLGDLTEHLGMYGRAAAFGVVSEVGTGGHLTVGGLGPLSRMLGTGADQVVAFEAVLANGSIVTATKDQHPDLFFAVRGAGWSFGIVTQFQMATIPAPQVTYYSLNFTAGSVTDLGETFKRWQRFVTNDSLPWSFSSTLTLAQDVMVFQGFYYGRPAEFDSLDLGYLTSTGNPNISITSNVVTTTVHDLLQTVTDLFGGVQTHFYAKSLKYTNQTLLSDSAVDELFGYINNTSGGTSAWFIVWDMQGGKTATLPLDSAAYFHRDAVFFQQAYFIDFSATKTVSPEIVTFLDGLNQKVMELAPGIGDGTYAGYVDSRLTNPQQAYWGSNLARLESIKASIDPNNVFRNPQSVQGAVSSR